MSKPAFFGRVANRAPRLTSTRRSSWIAVGLGVLALLGLLLWIAVLLIGELLGLSQSVAASASQSLRGGARNALEQLEKAVPASDALQNYVKQGVSDARGALVEIASSMPEAREAMAVLLPDLTPEAQPQRDVSGEDPGPVARYPGLARSLWQRGDGLAKVSYEGRADYVKVLDHYASGFVALGFRQVALSSAPDTETHEFTKDKERYLVHIAKLPKGRVSVRLETALK